MLHVHPCIVLPLHCPSCCPCTVCHCLPTGTLRCTSCLPASPACRRQNKTDPTTTSPARHRVFGWTKKNEIANGRWVMMGIGIGLMTELATGVSFIDQLKLMASYMGLVDLE